MSHLTGLQDALRAAGGEAVVVSSGINRRYLSGFAYTDGYMVVLPDRSFLLADFRYIEAARAAVDAAETEVLMPDRPMLEAVGGLLRDHGVRTVLFEEEDVSFALLGRFREAFGDAEPVGGASRMLAGLRRIKDAAEIAAMERAQRLTDEAFAHILGFLNPDRTELEVALEIEFFLRAHGSEGTAFETIAVSGANSSRPHGTPRPVRLERGFFTMDFGARVDGYCADMTRTVVLGRADADMKRLYGTVLRAQRTALGALRAGLGCAEADAAARRVIDEAGYEGKFGHGLGHGVGLEVHEGPTLRASAPPDSVLLPGHVVTVEPGVYLEGLYGCRIEDMATIQADGSARDLTASPKELIEL